jgi:hypothetical protein
MREGGVEEGAHLEATGGKRAWKDNDARHASAVMFDGHRREETRRELLLVKAYERRLRIQGDTTQSPAESLRPAFHRLLSFPADRKTHKGDDCERLVWAMRRFGLDGVFRGGAPEQQKGKGEKGKKRKREDASKQEGKQQATEDVDSRRGDLVEACRAFVDPMGKIRFNFLFEGDASGGAAKKEKLPLKMEICSGAGEWAVTQAKRDSGKANWVRRLCPLTPTPLILPPRLFHILLSSL